MIMPPRLQTAKVEVRRIITCAFGNVDFAECRLVLDGDGTFDVTPFNSPVTDG